MNKSEIITELEISRQQMDTLKVELLARNRENIILKSRLQELVDYGEGLDVKMPGQWSLEEQTTALRFMLKVAAREKVVVKGEENATISLDGKDLPSLARLAFAENEEQWREVRRLERKVTELTKYVETLREKKEIKAGRLESTSKETTDIDYHYSDSPDMPLSSGGEEEIVGMADLNQERIPESEAPINSENQIVTSSKPKLKKSRKYPESKDEITHEESETPLGQLTDEEFCDLQIRLLEVEAGHELSEQEQMVVEEVTAKFSETDKSENMLSNKEREQQPCQVILTGLSWGPTPVAVVRHVRRYEGVTKIKVEGDIAVVQFGNIDAASKFRDLGGNHVVEGFSLNVGDVEILDDLSDGKDTDDLSDGKDTPQADVEEECKSSVAVRVRRRGC